MGLQSSITMIGLVVMQTAVNAMGTVAVAAMTAYTKITYLFDCPFAALGTTIATFASQNHGARRIDRIGLSRDGERDLAPGEVGGEGRGGKGLNR